MAKASGGSAECHLPASRWDDWDVLHRLRETPRIFELLDSASGPELQVQTTLRREFPDDLVRGALNLLELRRKAASKFPLAARMWLDRKGLEQATSEPVAHHKAKRFKGRVWDYCSGIGADAMALAAGSEVIAVDSNPIACL